MYGVNQAECCSGETAACGPLTAEVASAHDPRHVHEHKRVT